MKHNEFLRNIAQPFRSISFALSIPHSALIIIFAIFNFQFSLFNLKAQTPQRVLDLSKQEASWFTVIGGNAVSPCIQTSYGVALLSDGRLLSACTDSGTVIWQRSIKGRPSPYITAFGDFLYVVTDNTKLNLVNPSGMTLWTATCPFAITDFPLVGRDGRVFVKGKKGIACYGLDGKRKWHASTEELGSLPISVLDDGSLVIFLKNPRKNQTVANRFSPFGEKLDDIVFSGIVTSAENSEKGVLVSLKNGSIGLVAMTKEGAADSLWVNGSGNTGGAFKICYSATTENAAFFFQNGAKTEAVIVQAETGVILTRFQVGQIASADFKIARATKAGYFISGAYSACEFSEDGTILYAAMLPPSKNWNSIFYTEKNYIILAMKDWTMKAFHMSQPTKSATSEKQKKSSAISYVSKIDYDPTLLEVGIRPLTTQKMAEIAKDFAAGDYGEKEKEYLSLIKTEAENYVNQSAYAQGQANFFTENAVYTQDLLYLMSKTGTREFSLLFARLLSGEIDESQFLSTISFAGSCGYDENGEMISALQDLLTNRVSPSQSLVLREICDATYEICRFMGRPVLNRQGKTILSRMLMPQYDKTTNDYARKTLEKMISLEKK